MYVVLSILTTAHSAYFLFGVNVNMIWVFHVLSSNQGLKELVIVDSILFQLALLLKSLFPIPADVALREKLQ